MPMPDKLRRTLPALGLAAALALAALAPLGWFAARDAALAGQVMLQTEDPDLLGEAGQNCALARRLYLDRGRPPASYAARSATAEETQLFWDTGEALAAGALGPWLEEAGYTAAPAVTLTGGTPAEQLTVSEAEGGLRQMTLTNEDEPGAAVSVTLASDGTAVGLQLSANDALPALPPEQAAAALCALAGLEEIDDWQELPGTGRGALLARYSPGAQLYLHINLDGGTATMGVASLPPDAVEAMTE